MTSVLAVSKVLNGQRHTVWGADSMISSGHFKTPSAKNNNKYVEFPDFVVLFSGHASVQQSVEDIRHRKWKKEPPYLKMRNRRDVHRFAVEVTSTLRRKLKDLGIPDDQGGDFQLLIATPLGVYESDCWAFVVEADTVTGGSGAPLLQSVLMSGYDKVTSLDELKALATQALEIACQIDLYSGPPITVQELRTANETNV